MCITSCKNSQFLKRSPPLNPSAEEWRPPHHIHPFHPPLPSAVAQVVALATHSPPKLQWHLPPHLLSYHHSFMSYVPLPHAWPHIVHHSTPFSFPATLRSYEAAPPLLGGEKKHVGQPEEKRLGTIVEGSKNVSKMWRPPPTTPPQRQLWKPRRITPSKVVRAGRSKVGAAATAATPQRRITPSKKAPAASVIDEKPPSSKTTVMIKNIPNQLRRDSMLEFLDSYCNAHSLEYDFMYLPMDFCKKDNLGYAFVNFTSGDGALKFKEILQNYKWGTVKTEKGFSYTSMKICVVTWARIQGKESLVKRFEDSKFACDNPGFLPVVFDPPRAGSNTTPPVVVGRLNHQNSKAL